MKKIFALTLALILALSLAACGGKNDKAPETPAETEKTADLSAFYASLTEGDKWPALMSLTEDAASTEMLDSYYPGLSEISTKQCGVYIAAITSAVGEIALVEVEDAEDAKTVEEIFQARIDYQVGDEENPGGAWYPETIEGWRKNSRIVTQGTCVMMAAGDAADDAVERFNALFA